LLHSNTTGKHRLSIKDWQAAYWFGFFLVELHLHEEKQSAWHIFLIKKSITTKKEKNPHNPKMFGRLKNLYAFEL